MKTLRLATVLAVAVFAAPTLAQTSSAYYLQQRGMDERFRIDLGGFFQNFSTTVSLTNSSGTAGTDINLEDDLGQDANQLTFAADGYWRFGRHGRLDFAYRGWSRSNSQTLARDITFGDTTYHVGATIDSSLRVNIVELYYSYSFVNNGDLELGLGLGLSAYFTRTELNGIGTIATGGGSTSVSTNREGRSVVAPIPSIKGYFAYALYPRLFLSGSAKGITATINGYHAAMQAYRGGLDWVFTKNVGIGAMYQYVKIDFSHAGTAGDLAASYRYSGPLGYVIIAF